MWRFPYPSFLKLFNRFLFGTLVSHLHRLVLVVSYCQFMLVVTNAVNVSVRKYYFELFRVCLLADVAELLKSNGPIVDAFAGS